MRGATHHVIDVAVTDSTVGVPNTSARLLVVLTCLLLVTLKSLRKPLSRRAQQPRYRPTPSVRAAHIVNGHAAEVYRVFHVANTIKARTKYMWILNVEHRLASCSATTIMFR